MTTLWDTTGTAVVQALAAERRSGGAVTSGLALTLVVVLEEKDTADVEAAVATAAAKHPMRVIMVLRHHIDAPVPRLDAEVSIGGRHGPGEAVVLRMFGRLALHAESVTLPLLAPDAPVVAWWYSETPKVIANDPLGVFADRRITNVIRDADPAASLRQRADRLRPRRHRPDLDGDHAVAGGAGGGVRHRLLAGHLGDRRPATRRTRRPSCWPAGCRPGWASPFRCRRPRASTSSRSRWSSRTAGRCR